MQSRWGKKSMSSEEERKKREIFDHMSPRRQQRILKKGYDKWDPFLEPKEPPFFREPDREAFPDAAEVFSGFLRYQEEQSSRRAMDPLRLEGAREICFGLLREQSERYWGMLDFCNWYSRRGGGDAGD